MISPALLDSIRAVAETGLVDRCDIVRYTETNTPDGVTETWATVATGVPVLLSMPGAAGSEAAGGGNAALVAISEWELWLPALTDVTAKDRLVVGARTFEVNAVAAISYEPLRRCNCAEVT